MARYIKKPEYVEAWQLNSGNPSPEWVKDLLNKKMLDIVKFPNDDTISWSLRRPLYTLNNDFETVIARNNDWIVEFYPNVYAFVDNKIFQSSYQPV